MSDVSNSARVVTRLRNASDLKCLLDGRADAIHLRAFASVDECNELVAFFDKHPRTIRFQRSAEKTVRLGTSFFHVSKAGNHAEEYSKPDILEAALEINDVLARVIGTVAASWPYGLETFSHQGRATHRSIVRRVDGGGYEPHDDNLATSMPSHPLASTLRAQLGLNLYLEVPAEGGELEGWHRRMSQAEYDSLRNPKPRKDYGVRREALGGCDWWIRPECGDLIIFLTSEIHAVRRSIGSRATWGFFLGYRDDDRPLLIWS